MNRFIGSYEVFSSRPVLLGDDKGESVIVTIISPPCPFAEMSIYSVEIEYA
jgi:hypothetical protein